jgi:hypothetical protein
MKLATTCQGLDGYLSVIGNCVIEFMALKMFVAKLNLDTEQRELLQTI